ncbi:latrophilin Cirl-like isoform X6 [Acropora muricata]|uniref:latrophilin Cirl-like isoform X6 n=1 Tax=Acropora muricata TaxID=159855 RepID=UPI0034E4210D
MTLAASKGIVLILVSLFHFGNFGHKANAWDFSTSSVIPDIKVVCQGERSRLQCDSASEKLIIYSAMFGRTEPGHVICPYEGDDKDDNYNCGEVDFTYWFKLLCENKTRCKIKVDNEVFKNPCPEQHLYLQLVFSCVKKYSTASTESATTNMPTLSTTAPSSFSSVLILPTTSVMAVASTSTVLVTQPTMTTQKSPKVHSTTSEGGKLPGIIPQQVENTGSSAVETDHSTDYAMVFLLQRRVPLLWRSLLVFVCFTFIVKASSISTKQAIQSSRLMK